MAFTSPPCGAPAGRAAAIHPSPIRTELLGHRAQRQGLAVVTRQLRPPGGQHLPARAPAAVL